MTNNRIVIVTLLGLWTGSGLAKPHAIPLLEMIAAPNQTLYLKPQRSSILYYTLRNNTNLSLPLTYQLNTTLATISQTGNTCGTAIAAHGTCLLPINFQAPATEGTQSLQLAINYRGRGPLIANQNVVVSNQIACELLNVSSYTSPFCQQQFQNVIQYSQNVFNPGNQQVIDNQTPGGMFGLYHHNGLGEEVCFVSCGVRELNGAPPDEQTVFELASVTKTFTGAILGKLLYLGDISSSYDLLTSYALPAGFSFSANEASVSFQQLATFSGGVCFSDAPSVNITSNNPVLNQSHFVADINALDPDPTSGLCSDGKPTKRPVYGHPAGTPPFLPSENIYSNSSFGLLGQSLMSIQGFPVYVDGFNNWMCNNIIDVLNMQHTNGYLPSDVQSGVCGHTTCGFCNLWTSSEYASGYHLHNQAFELGDPFPFTPWAAAGGIRSNAEDMIQYIRANLGFSTNNNQLDLIAGMQLGHNANDYLPVPNGVAVKPNIGSQSPLIGGQGYAWVRMLSPVTSDVLLGKIGGHTNFRSFVGFNKTKNYGVVILFNSGSLNSNGSSLGVLNIPPTPSEIGTKLIETAP